MKVDYFSDEDLIQIARRIGSEGDRIHKTERKRFLLLFKFLLRTGARVSEALLITPRDIDLKNLSTLWRVIGKSFWSDTWSIWASRRYCMYVSLKSW